MACLITGCIITWLMVMISKTRLKNTKRDFRQGARSSDNNLSENDLSEDSEDESTSDESGKGTPPPGGSWPTSSDSEGSFGDEIEKTLD